MPVCDETTRNSPHTNSKRRRLPVGAWKARDQTETNSFVQEESDVKCTSTVSRHSGDDHLTENTSSSRRMQKHGYRATTLGEQFDTRHFEDDSDKAAVGSLDTATEDCGTGGRTSGSLVSSREASKGGQQNAMVLGERRMNDGRYTTVESKKAAETDIASLDDDSIRLGATPSPPSVSSLPTAGTATPSPPSVSSLPTAGTATPTPLIAGLGTPSPPPPLSSPPTAGWTQYQQRQLEWALGQYPKFTKDRWDNISKAVPGKSTVKNKKVAETDPQINSGDSNPRSSSLPIPEIFCGFIFSLSIHNYDKFNLLHC